MLVILLLTPLFLILAIVWPIVAIAKQQHMSPEYSFTACIAAWYAQIMAMIGIVVFTIGIGYLLKSLIGSLHLEAAYGPNAFWSLGQPGTATQAAFEQQRQGDLLVRTPSFLVGGPIIYFAHAFLSRTVSPKGTRAPEWVRRGSQLLQTILLGTVSTLSSLLALNMVLGYALISPLGNEPRVPFGESLGFALAFLGAFVAHVLIWRRYPGGSWWSPPAVWPPPRQKAQNPASASERHIASTLSSTL